MDTRDLKFQGRKALGGMGEEARISREYQEPDGGLRLLTCMV